MGNFFRNDAPFFQKLNVLSELVILNLITIVCSLPVFTVGAAVTALYYTVEKLRRGESSSLRTYFGAFKANFKQATVIWVILLVVCFMISLCIGLYLEMNMPILVGCSVLALLVWGVVYSWVFPMLSRFHSSTFGALKNAVICGMNFLPLSLAMALVNLVPLALFLFVPGLFIRLGPLWIFLWASVAAYCNAGLLKMPFAAIYPESEEQVK